MFLGRNLDINVQLTFLFQLKDFFKSMPLNKGTVFHYVTQTNYTIPSMSCQEKVWVSLYAYM